MVRKKYVKIRDGDKGTKGMNERKAEVGMKIRGISIFPEEEARTCAKKKSPNDGIYRDSL
jgi:hypothetical protein